MRRVAMEIIMVSFLSHVTHLHYGWKFPRNVSFPVKFSINYKVFIYTIFGTSFLFSIEDCYGGCFSYPRRRTTWRVSCLRAKRSETTTEPYNKQVFPGILNSRLWDLYFLQAIPSPFQDKNEEMIARSAANPIPDVGLSNLIWILLKQLV